MQSTVPFSFLATAQALAAGDDAIHLHMRALSWCAAHAPDGTLPKSALTAVMRRDDVADLAARLVAEGIWSTTAGGWSVVTAHQRRVSAIRSVSGRKGAVVTNAPGRRTRQTDRPSERRPTAANPSASVDGVALYTGGRASESEPSEKSSEGRVGNSEGTKNEEKTNTNTVACAPAREAPTPKVAAVVIAPLPDPEGERILAALVEMGNVTIDGSSPAMRNDLSRRLANHAPDEATVAKMGALCATPKSTWDWAKTITASPVTVAWLLGAKVDGVRTGAPLAMLVTAARKAIANDERKRVQAEKDARLLAEDRARRDAALAPLTPEAAARQEAMRVEARTKAATVAAGFRAQAAAQGRR